MQSEFPGSGNGRIEEKDARISQLKRQLSSLQKELSEKQKTTETQIEVQAANINTIGEIAPDLCTHAMPCNGLVRGASLQIKLTRRGYASAFLQDKWGNFFNQNGKHIVSNKTEGTLSLWPGTSKEISHPDFRLFIVTSEEPLQTFAGSTPLKELPAGKNGNTWKAVHLRVPSADCGALRCP